MKQFAAAALALAGAVSAQAGPWEQCGGSGWTGPTTCVDGWECVVSNEWYSQCLQAGGGSSSAVTTATGTGTATSNPTGTSTYTPPTGTSTTVPSVDGNLFNIDGVTKYYAATNCYWCSFLTQPEDATSTFKNMAASGIKILRIWGFNDVATPQGQDALYFQYLSPSGSTINTGRYGLQLLDQAIQAAHDNGIKLIINFVNNWDDYGGIKAYTTAFGGDHNGWYTNEAAQAQYRVYVETLVNRYKASDAIFAWELANEPRCKGCDVSVITKWANETSAFVKSLDSKHMVTLGDEGFGLEGDGSYPYQYVEGVDFVKNLDIPTLDFGVFHFYPEHWRVPVESGEQWVKTHGAACVKAGKPCLFEEYGTTSNHCASQAPWQAHSLATEGVAADAFWQWGDQLKYGPSHNDGHTIYYQSSEWTCLVKDHVANIG